MCLSGASRPTPRPSREVGGGGSWPCSWLRWAPPASCCSVPRWTLGLRRIRGAVNGGVGKTHGVRRPCAEKAFFLLFENQPARDAKECARGFVVQERMCKMACARWLPMFVSSHHGLRIHMAHGKCRRRAQSCRPCGVTCRHALGRNMRKATRGSSTSLFGTPKSNHPLKCNF